MGEKAEGEFFYCKIEVFKGTPVFLDLDTHMLRAGCLLKKGVKKLLSFHHWLISELSVRRK